MKKRTKASKRRLNNLLMVLLLTAVLLIMSTYAWFTSNRTVFVQGIDLTVATSSGLQISADGDEWKTILTFDDIKNAAKQYGSVLIDQIPNVMEPVSTALDINTAGHLDMFYGEATTDLEAGSATYGQTLLASSKITEEVTRDDSKTGDAANGRFMAFDIFLKVDTAESDLFMSGSVSEIDTAKGIDNAARVALIRGNCEADFNDADKVRQTTTAGSTHAVLWEPNYDTHTKNGVNNAANLFWYAALNQTGAGYIPYDGLKTEFTNKEIEKVSNVSTKYGAAELETGLVKQFDKANMSNYWATARAEVPNMDIGSLWKAENDNKALSSGATKFRVYLWIEGQDVDCENNASGTKLEYNLSFSLDAITAAPTGGAQEPGGEDTGEEVTP